MYPITYEGEMSTTTRIGREEVRPDHKCEGLSFLGVFHRNRETGTVGPGGHVARKDEERSALPTSREQDDLCP